MPASSCNPRFYNYCECIAVREGRTICVLGNIIGRIGASLVPRPSAGGGKAWYTLFVHAPKFPDIPVIPWHSRILSVFELPECRDFSAHARTGLPSPRRRPGNEAKLEHAQCNTIL